MGHKEMGLAQATTLHLLLALLTLGPSFLAPPVAVALGAIPFELGLLLYRGRQRNGSFSWRGVVGYREAMRPRRLPGWRWRTCPSSALPARSWKGATAARGTLHFTGNCFRSCAAEAGA